MSDANNPNVLLPICWGERWRYMWEERAAIMEFDGNMTRAQAERLALEDVKRWRRFYCLDA